MQVRGSSILFYDEPVRLYSGGKSFRRMNNMRLQQKKQYSGGVTQGARKRISKAVTIMSQAIKPGWVTNPATGEMFYHKFSFITLTIANNNNITARQAYDDLFSHFLDWFTRTIGVKTYIWKAELQTRGQIHYHIVSPALIHYKDLQGKWNQLQRAAGLLDEFAKEHGHFNPPSTHIKETKNVKNTDRYILKELNKQLAAAQVAAISKVNELLAAGELEPSLAEEKIEEIKAEKICTIGKIWGCSENLSGVGYFVTPADSVHEEMIAQWEKDGWVRVIREDFFTMVFCDAVDPPDILRPGERQKMDEYLKFVLDGERPEVIPEVFIQMDAIDVAKSYTMEQLKIFLN
jgi:hypothetical protein